ncbi:MAG: hypothetical protein WD035_11905 [Balneolaceae bacterium]
MSSNSIPVDPVKKSDFYSELPGREWNLDRIRLQSLSGFHRLFQDELMKKQQENDSDPEGKQENSLKRFYREQIELLYEEANVGKVLSHHEKCQLSLLQLIKKNRHKLEVSHSLPISSLSRCTPQCLLSYAENYVFNQQYYRNPKGDVYTGKL